MNKEEIFNIFYGKETWDILRKFQFFWSFEPLS